MRDLQRGTTHASGYILIHGGWNNKISVIARLDEHGKDRHERNEGMVLGKSYHWKVMRKINGDGSGDLEWYLDGKLWMMFHDLQPLRGPGHDRFAFNSWETDAYYSNVKVTPI